LSISVLDNFFLVITTKVLPKAKNGVVLVVLAASSFKMEDGLIVVLQRDGF